MVAVYTKPVRILIVEDYKLTRVGLHCALDNYEDIEVMDEAQNAEDALKKCASFLSAAFLQQKNVKNCIFPLIFAFLSFII